MVRKMMHQDQTNALYRLLEIQLFLLKLKIYNLWIHLFMILLNVVCF